MTHSESIRDLAILVADKNIEFAVKGFLERTQSLRIRSVSADVYVHPESDPGCALRSAEFLRPFHRQYRYALVVFDREGCGRERLTRDQIEAELEERLLAAGWKDRSAAVVLDPELEIWVWSDSPQVGRILGWTSNLSLRAFLCQRGHWHADQTKPARPKEALHDVLRVVRKHRSSALYRELAKSVGLERCVDGAFGKLRQVLQTWFSVSDSIG